MNSIRGCRWFFPEIVLATTNSLQGNIYLLTLLLPAHLNLERRETCMLTPAFPKDKEHNADPYRARLGNQHRRWWLPGKCLLAENIREPQNMLHWKGPTRIIDSNFQPCTGPSIKLLTMSAMSWTEAPELKALLNMIFRGFKFCSYLQTHGWGPFTIFMRWEYFRWRETPPDMLLTPKFAPEPLMMEEARCHTLSPSSSGALWGERHLLPASHGSPLRGQVQWNPCACLDFCSLHCAMKRVTLGDPGYVCHFPSARQTKALEDVICFAHLLNAISNRLLAEGLHCHTQLEPAKLICPCSQNSPFTGQWLWSKDKPMRSHVGPSCQKVHPLHLVLQGDWKFLSHCWTTRSMLQQLPGSLILLFCAGTLLPQLGWPSG